MSIYSGVAGWVPELASYHHERRHSAASNRESLFCDIVLATGACRQGWLFSRQNEATYDPPLRRQIYVVALEIYGV